MVGASLAAMLCVLLAIGPVIAASAIQLDQPAATPTSGTTTTVVTFILHESLRDEPPPAVPEDARLAESALRISNQVSFGLLVGVAIAGVVDAQVRFQPSRVTERPRALPPDLLELELGLQPSGVSLSGRF